MFFEIVMLICFGAAWPLSIYKTLKSPSCAGKSLLFLTTILIGYISGILYKLNYNYDKVVFLYVINTIMVSTDLCLTYLKKKRVEEASEVYSKAA